MVKENILQTYDILLEACSEAIVNNPSILEFRNTVHEAKVSFEVNFAQGHPQSLAQILESSRALARYADQFDFGDQQALISGQLEILYGSCRMISR